MNSRVVALLCALIASMPPAPAQLAGNAEYHFSLPWQASARVNHPVLRRLTGKMDVAQPSLLYGRAEQFGPHEDLVHAIQLRGSNDSVSPETPMTDRPPEERRAILDAQLQRAQGIWDGTRLDEPEQRQQKSLDVVRAELEAQQTQAKKEWAGIHLPAVTEDADSSRIGYDLPDTKVPPERPLTEVEAQLAATHDDMQSDEDGMSAEPLPAETKSSLEAVRSKLQAQHQQAESNAAGTRLQPVTTVIAAVPQAGGRADGQKVLSWDQWYARLAETVKTPLMRALAKLGNPAGYLKVQVTVWPDHRLTVEPMAQNPTPFGRAVVAAYQSLNGNPALEYPLGSHRSVVTYIAENWHDTPGVATGVHSQPLKGDKECLAFELWPGAEP